MQIQRRKELTHHHHTMKKAEEGRAWKGCTGKERGMDRKGVVQGTPFRVKG